MQGMLQLASRQTYGPHEDEHPSERKAKQINARAGHYHWEVTHATVPHIMQALFIRPLTANYPSNSSNRSLLLPVPSLRLSFAFSAEVRANYLGVKIEEKTSEKSAGTHEALSLLNSHVYFGH